MVGTRVVVGVVIGSPTFRGMVNAAPAARRATIDDASAVARLLHDFNSEFDTPSPGEDVLTSRLRRLLAADDTLAMLAGEPPHAVALVTLRPNVWYDGPVALLDELYVAPSLRGRGIGTEVVDLLLDTLRARDVELIEINVDADDVGARRFYERHGFTGVEPTTGDHALYYVKQLER